jgi:uncharacterized RmlC-like cupin family protein
MARQEAIATDGLWAGFVRTEAGTASAWHHHGAYESSIYMIEGTLRFEYGPGGTESVEAGPGDFIYVPKYCVHREVSHDDTRAIVVRGGHGAPVFNADGPEPT